MQQPYAGLQVYGQETDENENPAYDPILDKEDPRKNKTSSEKKISSQIHKRKDKYPYKDWVQQEKERKQPYFSKIKDITNIYSIMIDSDESNIDSIHEALASLNFNYGKGRLATPYLSKKKIINPDVPSSAEEKGIKIDIPRNTSTEETKLNNPGQEKNKENKEDIKDTDIDDEETSFVFIKSSDEIDGDPRGPIPQESLNIPAFLTSKNSKLKNKIPEDPINSPNVVIKSWKDQVTTEVIAKPLLFRGEVGSTPMRALFDSGAGSQIVSRKFVEALNIPTVQMSNCIRLRYGDGATAYTSTETVPLKITIQGVTFKEKFIVTPCDTPSIDLIFGLSFQNRVRFQVRYSDIAGENDPYILFVNSQLEKEYIQKSG